jgi:hypothetical protein
MTMYLVRTNQPGMGVLSTNTSLSVSSYNVPTRSVANLVGRKHLLEGLKQTLYPSQASHERAAGLFGIGGQGKTQAALEFH